MKLVFDIGFNVGEFSQYIMKNNENCIIIGVEPNYYIKPISFNHPNVTVLNKAVSNVDNHMLDFYIGVNHVLSTANPDWMKKRFVNEEWYVPIKIETITIDKLIELYGIPDLIKIDVEGFELNVITGLTKKIESKIMFEWTEEFFYENTIPCVKHLQSLGYMEFGYTHSSTENSKTFNVDYNSWEKLNIHNIIKQDRNMEWGMIYCK